MTEQEVQRMVYRIVGDATSYQRMARDVSTSTSRMTKDIDRNTKSTHVFGQTIDNLGTKMSAFAGSMRAMVALESPLQVVRDAVKLAAQAETSRVNLGTLLGGDDAAAALQKDLQKFAADTPLNMPAIESVTTLLLQGKTTAAQVIPLMRQLGDVALGNADKFKRIALAYTQMNNAGRVTREELNQMRDAGFSPLAEMARILKVDLGQLDKMLEQGKVPMAVMNRALRNLTSAGGKFNDGMLSASRTLEGLWSTMGDDVDSAKRAVGEFVAEAYRLRDAMRVASAQAKEFEKWFRALDPAVKAVTVSVTALLAVLGTAVVTWKISALAVGMVVGNLKDMVVTARWLWGGFVALLNPVNMLTAAFTGLKWAVGAAFGPVGLVVIALTSVVAALVQGAGGLGPAMRKAGAVASAAWEWIKSTATTAWAVISDAAARFFAFVRPVWDLWAGMVVAQWDMIRGAAGKAWDWVTAKTAAAVAFMTPIWTALRRLVITVWEQVSMAAENAWRNTILPVIEFVAAVAAQAWTDFQNVVVGIFNFLTGASVRTFTNIRDNIVAAVYAVEFVVMNLRRAWDIMYLAALLGAVRMENRLKYMFTVVLPHALMWFATNWRQVLTDAFNLGGTVFRNLSENIARIFRNMGSIISGDKSIADFWTPLGQGFQTTVRGLNIPDRIPTQLEQNLQSALDAALGGFGEDMAAHVARRMFQPPVAPDEVIPPATVAETQRRVDDLAEGMSKSMDKPLGKWDAALRNSSEAITRINDFRDANRGNPEKRGLDPRAARDDALRQQQLAREQVAQTKAVRKAVEKIAAATGFVFQPANLGGGG